MFRMHFKGWRRPPWHEEEAEESEFQSHGRRWERRFPPRRPHARWQHHGPGWFPPFFAWPDEAAFWRERSFGGNPFDEEHEHFGSPFWRRGPFGGDPFDEGGRGRRRHRRGDIKYVLLELLAEQPRHGYELIKELEQRYAGFYRPSPGSVYPTLQMLEDQGYLTSDLVDGKRVYTITDSGRQLLAEYQQRRADEGVPSWRYGFRRGKVGPELNELHQSMLALAAGIMQVARHGTPDQVRAVKTLLDTTRREIYAILAQDRGDEAAGDG